MTDGLVKFPFMNICHAVESLGVLSSFKPYINRIVNNNTSENETDEENIIRHPPFDTDSCRE